MPGSSTPVGPRGIGKVDKGALAALHPQVLGATVLERWPSARASIPATSTNRLGHLQSGRIPRRRPGAHGRSMPASPPPRAVSRWTASVGRHLVGQLRRCIDHVGDGGCRHRRGTEMMSSYGANALKTRSPFLDSGNEHLRAPPSDQRGVAADAIATVEKIDRRAVDELAAESQRRAEVAIKGGRFDRSLVTVHHLDGSVALDREEYPRPRHQRTPWPRCPLRSRRWLTIRSTRMEQRTAPWSCRSFPA